jgi:hypothetical protein
MNSGREISNIGNPVVAYVAPFCLFLGLTALEDIESLSPYYPWIYTGKIVLVTACWAFFCRRYPKPQTSGMAAGVIIGIVGAVIWVALSRTKLEFVLDEALPTWLRAGQRVAYNPFTAIGPAIGQWAFLIVRLTGLAIVVPLVEEIFWRGFLIRYLIAERFEEVDIGRFTLLSFAVVTVAFTLVHPEKPAALVWGALINGLYYRTRNLWACIVAHAVTNLLLGAYIVATGAWELW